VAHEDGEVDGIDEIDAGKADGRGLGGEGLEGEHIEAPAANGLAEHEGLFGDRVKDDFDTQNPRIGMRL
jgi:hypothetical protein